MVADAATSILKLNPKEIVRRNVLKVMEKPLLLRCLRMVLQLGFSYVDISDKAGALFDTLALDRNRSVV